MSADVQRFSHYPACPPPVDVPLTTVRPHPCSYLPDQSTSLRAMLVEWMPPEVYEGFLDAGFRRSGRMVYQPICPRCRRCVPLRVVVEEFRPNKQQRRCWRRNQDLQVAYGTPAPDAEKFDLYCRYLRDWHGRPEVERFDSFVDFLYSAPVSSIEFTYREPSGRLVAVAICDPCGDSLSSVYCYHDPRAAPRGLGTFSVLREIAYAAEIGLRYYHLGYWVDQCGSVVYKSSFRPHELLGTDGSWRRVDAEERDRIDSAQ